MTDKHPNNPQQTTSNKRGIYKWIIGLSIFFALAWFLQQQGPITINGISLTVPVSEEAKP